MSNRALATGVFRAWGVMWLISIVPSIPETIRFASRDVSQSPGWEVYPKSSAWLALGISLAIGLFLVFAAGRLARVVFPTEEALAISVDAASFQGIIFSAVGLYYVISGARSLIGATTFAFQKDSVSRGLYLERLWKERWEVLVAESVTIAFGLAVFFGSRGLGNLWRRYWHQEAPAAESAED